MITRAALIPIPKWLPFVSVLPRAKNIPLGREDEVRADGKCEIGETRFEQINGTTRVNRPDRTGILQFANQFHALRVQNWFANSGHQGAIEINAQQFDW